MVMAPRLRRLRERRLLTQEQLGKLAGVGEITIHRIESGKPARLSTLRKLADALAVTPDTLLGEDSAEGQQKAAA